MSTVQIQYILRSQFGTYSYQFHFHNIPLSQFEMGDPVYQRRDCSVAHCTGAISVAEHLTVVETRLKESS